MKEDNPVRIATVVAMASMPEYRFMTASALRQLIFKAGATLNARGQRIPGNGLAEAGAIIRVGRRVYIDLDRFDKWLLAQRTAYESTP